MNHNLKGTEVSITPELRAYVARKLAQADKFLQDDSTAHADVELQYSPMRDGGKYRAEFTLRASGALFRAGEWGSNLHEAIDLSIEELVKELRRSKKKQLYFLRRGALRVKEYLRGFRDRF
jgi:ribosomal subunit interface protein